MSNLLALKHKGDFIGGAWVVSPKPDGEFKDVSPADLADQMMTVKFQHDHVDDAVMAARKAYGGWSRLSMDARRAHLLKLKEVFDTHSEQMAQIIARDTGKPLWDAMSEAKLLGGKIDVTMNQSAKLIAEERIVAKPYSDADLAQKVRSALA